MNIGSLVASLGFDTSSAMQSMTAFERMMISLTQNIDSNLAGMARAMGVVGASATAMGNQSVAAMNKITIAAKLSAYEMRNVALAQPNRMFVAGSSGTSIAPLPPVIKAPAVTPIVNDKPAVAALGRMNSALAMTAQRFRTFGYLASITLTAPIILLSKSIIQLGKDYEYTMQKIVGLTSATQKMTDDWSKSILRLAPQLGKGPKELAESMYFVASAGFRGAEAIDVLTLSAKAAEAGLGETRDVAQFLTSTLNAYAGTGLTAAKATDILVAGVNYGKVEANAFASAIGSVIPIASAMGVSLGQVVGTMAAMTLQGATAANAAVYLKGILNSILKIKPENQAGKALAELGSSAIELRNMLASGPNGVMNVLLKIQDWAKTNPYILNKVFGNIRSLTGDLSLMGNHLTANQKVITLVVNAMGDLDVAVSAVSDTLKVRWDKAMAGLQSGVIRFGDTISKYIMPIVEGFIKLLNKLMLWFANLSEPMKKIVMGFIAFAAAMGPLSLLLSLHMYIINGLTIAYTNLAISSKTALVSMAAIAPEVAIFVAVFTGVALVLSRIFDSENALKKMTKELNTEITKEVFSLNSLFNSLASANLGTKERSDAIKIVNSEYGEYLNKLLTEKSTLADIYAAQTQATEALVANISVKKYAEELEKQKANIATATEDSFGKIMTAWADTFGVKRLGSFIIGLNKAMDEAVAVGMKKNASGRAESLVILEKFYTDYVIKMGAGANKKLKFTDFGKAFYELLPVMRESKEVITTLEGRIKAFGSVGRGSIENVVKAAGTLSPILINLGKAFGALGSPVGMIFTNMGNALKNVASSLGSVNNEWEDLKDNTDTISGVWEDMTKELNLLQTKANIYKTLGHPFDLAKESASVFLSTMDTLLKEPYSLNIDSKPIQDLIKMIEKLGVTFDKPIKEVTSYKKIMEDLAASLVSIKMQKFIEPSFDTTTAELEARKKAYESYRDVISDQRIVRIGAMDIIPIENLVPQEVLDRLNQLYYEYKTLEKTRNDLISTNFLELLNSESNAYGGLARKIEIVNQLIIAQEKNVKNLLLARINPNKKGLVASDEDIRKEIELLIKLRTVLVDLEHTETLKYLNDLNNAFRTGTSYSDVLGEKISILSDKLKQLSKDGYGGSLTFKELSKEMQNLITQQQIIDSLTQSFSNLFYNIMQGTQSISKSIKQFANDVLSSFEKILAQNLAEKLMGALTPKDDKKGKGGKEDSGWLKTLGSILGLSKSITAANKASIPVIQQVTEAEKAAIPVAQAVTTAKSGEAIAGATASGAKMPFPMNIIAIALGIAAVIGALVLINRSKMAGGGIVPGGFPNDTYPALLTSGETVLPKSLSPSMLRNSSDDWSGKVEFEIEGDRLVGILRKQGKKLSIY